jgi:hypothetical protein
MRLLAILLLACAAASSPGARAAPARDTPAPGACASEPAMPGMRERIDSLRGQMDRIEWTVDRAERRVLLDLHLKRLREGLREARRRELGAACRVEILGSLLDEMVRAQLVMSEQEAR